MNSSKIAAIGAVRPIFGLLVLWCFAASGFSQSTGRHHVTLADLGASHSVQNMQLSPDGKTLAYVVSDNTSYPANAPQIWLVSTKEGSTPKRSVIGSVPTWSPDGKRIAFYSGKAGGMQLSELNVATGAVQQITTLAGGIDPDPFTRIAGYVFDAQLFTWSPDGTKIIFASQAQIHSDEKQSREVNSAGKAAVGSGARSAAETPLVLTNSTPPKLAISGIFSHGFADSASFAGWEKGETRTAPRINQLFIVDVNTKAMRQLTTDKGGYFNPSFSPDGTAVICSSTEGIAHPTFGSPTSLLVAINITSGAKQILVDTPGGDKRLATFSPDGKQIAYLAGSYEGRQEVFVVPAGGGAPVEVAENLDRYVESFNWLADSKSIAVEIKDGMSVAILSVATDGSDHHDLSDAEAASRAYITASHAGDLAWQQSDGTRDNSIYFRAANENGPRLLVDLNPQTKNWLRGEQSVLRWKNNRGDDMEGVVILPPDYQQGKKYPLILDCYPGMNAGFKASPYGGNYAWADRGYVIFNPNARAPHVWMNPSKGKDYDLAAKGPNGWEVTFDDVITGVDELVRQGIVDENRMGLFGFSNGGGVADYMVTKTNRFKCAVSQAGVFPDWLRPGLLEAEMDGVSTFAGGITPWDDPMGFIQLSAVFRAKNIETPMLLADGDNDGDFLLGVLEMYNSLRYLGKKVTFVRYPGQAHVLTGWALKDFWGRTAAFFDKYLLPERPTN
jgi:acylaminoacyl-peptidase